MAPDSVLYSTTPASRGLGQLRWVPGASKAKSAFYQEIFCSEEELPCTCWPWAHGWPSHHFSPFLQTPLDYFCLQWLLLGLTCRCGLTCKVRAYQGITCLMEMGFIITGSCDASSLQLPACLFVRPLLTMCVLTWVSSTDGDCCKPTAAFCTISFAVPETVASPNHQYPSATRTVAFNRWALATLPAPVPPSQLQVPQSWWSHKFYMDLFRPIFSSMPRIIPVLCSAEKDLNNWSLSSSVREIWGFMLSLVPLLPSNEQHSCLSAVIISK